MEIDGHENWSRHCEAHTKSLAIHWDEKSRDWMNLTKAADFLSISSTALRHAAQRGEIQAEHPLREGPWLFSRVTLESEAAKQLVNRIQHSPYSHKTDSAADEPLLFNVIARCAL